MRTRLASLVVTILLVGHAASIAQTPSPGARDRARGPYQNGLDSMKEEAWEEAVKSFRAAIEIDPAFEMAYYMLGRSHMAQKKFELAASAYERCRALYQQQSGRQYASAQERQRTRDTRLREIDEVLRNYQSGSQTGRVLDTIRQLQNQRRELEEAMSRGNASMTLNITVPAYVSTALGSAYFRMGNLAAAEQEYKAALESDPKAGEVHSNLAVVFMETGRLDEAEKSIKAAERAGFKVHPELKEEIKKRRKVGSS